MRRAIRTRWSARTRPASQRSRPVALLDRRNSLGAPGHGDGVTGGCDCARIRAIAAGPRTLRHSARSGKGLRRAARETERGETRRDASQYRQLLSLCLRPCGRCALSLNIGRARSRHGVCDGKPRHNSCVHISTDPQSDVARARSWAAICVQDFDAPCVLQFAWVNALCCALHRSTSQVIHRSGSYIIRVSLIARFVVRSPSFVAE